MCRPRKHICTCMHIQTQITEANKPLWQTFTTNLNPDANFNHNHILTLTQTLIIPTFAKTIHHSQPEANDVKFKAGWFHMILKAYSTKSLTGWHTNQSHQTHMPIHLHSNLQHFSNTLYTNTLLGSGLSMFLMSMKFTLCSSWNTKHIVIV